MGLLDKQVTSKLRAALSALPQPRGATVRETPMPQNGCDNTCESNYIGDGKCQDGLMGTYTNCDPGTDCDDCGPRPVPLSGMAFAGGLYVPRGLKTCGGTGGGRGCRGAGPHEDGDPTSYGAKQWITARLRTI